MARRQASFDDLLDIGSKLPWRVAVLSAVCIYVGLHVVAAQTSSPATGTTLVDLGGFARHSVIHVAAAIFQYVVPIGLLLDALVGFIKQSRAKSLVDDARTNPNAISEMSWRDFERFIGEAFRRNGFQVVDTAVPVPTGASIWS
jgi:restriction system protein